MATVQDSTLGPEIEGMRITVQTLLPHFLDPVATESYICRLYDLTPEQVAAARAYVLKNADLVLANYVALEERAAAGNPVEVVRAANETRTRLAEFRDWLARKQASESTGAPVPRSASGTQVDGGASLTFRQWLAERATGPGAGP